ncbi:hypothetical protein NQZ68_038996 [Dissostichus eleginoides]|nr:hypothetical protein NQZ68_038996 [Dissostichus eleginoides]
MAESSGCGISRNPARRYRQEGEEARIGEQDGWTWLAEKASIEVQSDVGRGSGWGESALFWAQMVQADKLLGWFAKLEQWDH